MTLLHVMRILTRILLNNKDRRLLIVSRAPGAKSATYDCLVQCLSRDGKYEACFYPLGPKAKIHGYDLGCERNFRVEVMVSRLEDRVRSSASGLVRSLRCEQGLSRQRIRPAGKL